MFTKNNIISIICISIFTFSIPVFADDISDMKALINYTVAKLVQKYETRIAELETENNKLKQEIVALKGTVSTPVITPAAKPVVSTPVSWIISSATPKSDAYTAVMKQANDNLSALLTENNLPGFAAIGLFEFIEPNAVFLSFDDGNNPVGITAFKSKVLYTFNNNLLFTRVGLFDLDYASQKYRTLFGSNPYVKSVRTRVQNPSYKGKLFETPTVSSTGSTSTTSVSTPISTPVSATPSGEVTLAQIKSAYDKTKLLDAIKLSESYIVKNPNDLDVLRIRYRSFYIIGKYDDSLAEIKKIEAIEGSSFERTIACDAAVVGKIAKKLDVSTYYSAICKKK